MKCANCVFMFVKVSTAEQIISHFEGDHADLVVCDGAPDGKYLHVYARSSLIYPFEQT